MVGEWRKRIKVSMQKSFQDIQHIQESVDRIIELYGGRECRILVVGHYHQGGRFIEAFLDLEMRGRFDHENTGMTSLKEQDGIFCIEYLNRI